MRQERALQPCERRTRGFRAGSRHFAKSRLAAGSTSARESCRAEGDEGTMVVVQTRAHDGSRQRRKALVLNLVVGGV